MLTIPANLKIQQKACIRETNKTSFFFSKEKEKKPEKYQTKVNHTINEMRIKS